MDRLKGSLKELRDKRDQLFKERGELKRKEDDAKNEMRYVRKIFDYCNVVFAYDGIFYNSLYFWFYLGNYEILWNK